MSVENYFQEQLQVNPNIEVESNSVVFTSPATVYHTDSDTKLFINNVEVPLGTYSLSSLDSIYLKITSSGNYAQPKHGIIKIEESGVSRYHTFSVVTKKEIQPIHVEQFLDKIPFEMNKYEDGNSLSEYQFIARAKNHRITTFDKTISIQYPDEQFKMEYDIGANQFNSDTSFITCSFYNNKVLRHSRKTKRLIASIPVSGHPCEFAEVPNIPSVDTVTKLFVTLSDKDKVVIINNGNAVDGEIVVGNYPTGIVYNGTSVYVSNTNDNTISKIDYTSSWNVVATIPVGLKPFKLVVDSDSNVWVACAGDDAVYKITGTTAQRYHVGEYPRGIVATETKIFVTLSKTDSVVSLNLDGSLSSTFLDVGIHPYSITRPISIGESSEPPFVRDDYYSSNNLLINVEDSYYGAHNSDITDSSGADITVYGTPQHTSFSPYQDAWSCEFNNSPINVQSSAYVNIGTSDFTVEFWVNFKEISQQGIFHTSATNLTGSMWCGYRYDGLMVAISGKEGTQSFGFWFTPEVNRWTHVAITRDSTNSKIFVNGELRSVTSKLNGVDIKQNGWVIGNNSDTSLPFSGFIADFHVTKTCKYAANFNPNSSKIIPDLLSGLYCLGGKNFSDESGKNLSLFPSFGAKITHFSPYSLGFSRGDNYSGYFSGVDYCRTTIDQNIGFSDFTFETWVYRDTNTPNKLLELGNLSIYENGTISGVFGALSNIHTGAWYHLAIVRRDGTYYRYLNGVLQDSVTMSNNINGKIAYICQNFTGYIMNYRFTASAVYTSSFAVPSKVLVLPTTKVLLKFKNAGVVDVTGKNLIKTQIHPYTHSLAKFGDFGLSFNTKIIVVPHSNHFTLWDRDFTVEFYLNTTDHNCTIMAKANADFTQNSWNITLQNGYPVVSHSTLGNSYLIGSGIISDGVWHHVVLSKVSRSEKLLVDGIRVALQTYCINTFIDLPNTLHEQTTIPLVVMGNMDIGEIFNLTGYTTFEIISGGEYAEIVGGNLVTGDIVPDQSIIVRAVTVYRGETFTATKPISITHNPELVSIEIVGSNSIIERASSSYSIVAHLSDGTSFIPNNEDVIWEVVSPYATVINGIVQTNNITDSSKIITLHATYTNTGIEPVTKTTSKFIVVEYHPELTSSTITYDTSSFLAEGARVQLVPIGTLENGNQIQLVSNVWSIISGNAYATIDSSGIISILQDTVGNSVTVRCTSEYLAGIVTNTVFSDFTFTILDDFVCVEMLISGDVLITTETTNLVSVTIQGLSIVSEDESTTYQAIGTFDNGTTKNVSAFTTWSIVSGEPYASISSSGVLTPSDVLVDRNITIMASTTKSGINVTATKNVVIDYVPKLSSVVINSTQFAELSTSVLSATAYWDDGTPFDPTAYSTWELVSGTAATVSTDGTITTLEVPNTNSIIRVRCTVNRGGLTVFVEKDITILDLPKLLSIDIIKGSGVASSGASIQFTTTGILEDSSTINASPYTTWSIQSGVGSIDASGILSIPLNSVGEIIVISASATYQNGTATDTYELTVVDDFSNVELLISGDILGTTIIPQLMSGIINGEDIVTEQTSTQYTLTGQFNNGGANQDLSSKTSWSIVAGASFATISSGGTLTAANITGGDKSVTIRATTTHRGITIITDKTITIDIVPIFNSVTISGPNSVIEQQQATYTTIGGMDDGSTFDATPYTTWSVISGSSYVSIDSSGVVTANNITASNKTAVIRATVVYSGITIIQDKTINIVWEPIFESTTISGNNSIYEYGYTQLTITGFYDGGTPFDAAPYTTWAVVSGGAHVSINSSGYVTGISVGTSIVEATTTHLGVTVTNQYSIAVLSAQPLVELLISGDVLSTTIYPVLISGIINGSATVTEQTTSQYTLTGQFNNGGADQDLTAKTTWSIISGGAYASINSSGLLTANNISGANQSVTIRAVTVHRGISITTDRTITIQYIQTFSSVVINGSNSINENSSSSYTATGVMDDGVTFDASPYTTWSIVSGGAYASIDSSGIVTTNNVTANQSITIRASVTYSGTTIIQDKVVSVVWIPILSYVTIFGLTEISAPNTTQLTITGYMEDSSTFDAAPYTTWSIVSGGAYASINSSGLLTLSPPPVATTVTVQASVTYGGVTKTDTHNVLVNTAGDAYFANVGILLNGENATPYSEFMLYVAIQLNGEAA